MRRIILIAGLALGLLMPSVAVADGPSAADEKKAKKLILKASRHKRKADKWAKRKRTKKRAQVEYKKAALAFMEAYSLVEHPAIVFKLAEVYRARGEYRWARRGFKRYLELEPTSADSEKAREAVEELANVIAEREAAGDTPAEEATPELDPTAVFGLEKPDEPEEPEQPDEPEQPEKPDEPEEPEQPEAPAPTGPPAKQPGKWLKWGGIGGAGVGAIFLSIGIKFGVDASSAASDLSNNDDQWNLNDRQRITDGQSANDKMILFTTLGAISVVAGGVVYYLGYRADEKAARERGLSVTPTVGDGSFAVTLSGRF